MILNVNKYKLCLYYIFWISIAHSWHTQTPENSNQKKCVHGKVWKRRSGFNAYTHRRKCKVRFDSPPPPTSCFCKFLSANILYWISTNYSVSISEGPNIFNISTNGEIYVSTQLKHYLLGGGASEILGLYVIFVTYTKKIDGKKWLCT